MKEISLAEASESETVKVALEAVSLDVVTSAMESVGALSSSAMVSVAVSSEKVELVALERVKVAVSLFSSVESARIGTLKVPEVSPAEMVREPDVEV